MLFLEQARRATYAVLAGDLLPAVTMLMTPDLYQRSLKVSYGLRSGHNSLLLSGRRVVFPVCAILLVWDCSTSTLDVDL